VFCNALEALILSEEVKPSWKREAMPASKTDPVAESKERQLSWRVIPVVVLLFLVVIPLTTFWVGKGVDLMFGWPAFPPFPLNFIIGIGVLVVAGLLCWGSMYQLYRAGHGFPWGDVDDAAQSRELVTTGLYRYTRNPMILGFLILLSGIGWFVQSITAIVVIPLIVFVLLWVWLKRREEPQLEQRFGDAYRIYRDTTPLIIPRPWRRAQKPQEKNI
jgi:protein-S-isoprenylcysteine O-methyltransferase Ste14